MRYFPRINSFFFQIRGRFATDFAARSRQSSPGYREAGRLPRAVPGAKVRAVLQLQHRRYGDERHDAEQQGHQHQSLRYAALERAYTNIYTARIRDYAHTRIRTSYTYAKTHTFNRRGSCANGGAPTYVPATKHSPWPQSIHHPLLRSLLLCYIIRSGVRERCSWHVVRLCGTGTRHGASAQSGRRRRPRGDRLQRHRRSGQPLLQELADHEDRGQEGESFASQLFMDLIYYLICVY